MRDFRNFHYKCDDGTILSTVQGKKSEKDFIILTTFPRSQMPHSLEFIGAALRLKANVEDINYPPPGDGRGYLFSFLRECVFNEETPIKEICKKYKIG